MKKSFIPNPMREEYHRAVRAGNGLMYSSPLQSVLMVGSHIDPDSDALMPTDGKYLVEAGRQAARFGYRLADDPDVYVANLNYGDDFLIEQPQVDMVVFAYVYHSLIGIFAHARMAPDERAYMEQSHHAFDDRNIWHRALVQTGAQLAVNIVGEERQLELPTGCLCKDPYSIAAMPALISSKPYSTSIRQAYDVLVRAPF